MYLDACGSLYRFQSFYATELALILDHRNGGFEQMKAWWSRWPNMPAVRNNRIYLMDSNVLDRATPRMVDGLELLLQHIHPGMLEETK